MKDLNLKKVMGFVKKDIQANWNNLDFEYEIDSEKFKAKANLELNNIGDVMAIITIYPGGGASFRAVFDKIDETPTTLDLVNEYNSSKFFFNAYIRDDGYLELEHFIIAYEDSFFKEYASEFLTRLANSSDDEKLLAFCPYIHD